MKVEWIAEDIKPGRHVGKKDRNETWMIGYKADTKENEARYSLVSLSDGMITTPITAEAMAQMLNKCGDLPIELLD